MGKNKNDIRIEIKNTLKNKLRYGESKHEAKDNNSHLEGIYSIKTAKNYSKVCNDFAKFVMQKNRHITLLDAKRYVKDYIEQSNKDDSAYTTKLKGCALAKLYSCKTSDFGVQIDNRRRRDITRSRNQMVVSPKTGKLIKNTKTRSGRFSEKKHADFVEFCRATGLRRSEITNLKGNQLIEKNGRFYLDIVGKGGRHRTALVRGDHVDDVVKKCKEAKDNLVWSKVPAADIHSYRSQYATMLYNELVRPLDTIPRKEKYFCRGELKGTTYDKKAMQIVSQNLGHNRISVIAEHYLR